MFDKWIRSMWSVRARVQTILGVFLPDSRGLSARQHDGCRSPFVPDTLSAFGRYTMVISSLY